jgi:tripeptide aminopeptidase
VTESLPAESPVELPAVVERFLRYVRIDTEADRDSRTTPSSARQKDLGRMLAEELRALGVADAAMDDHGYVYASLPAVGAVEGAPRLALLAHVDTSPDAPGGPVEPCIHRHYDGGVLSLPGDPSVELDPARSPELSKHIGHDLITSDGTTLLGSDDKAGVAVIMQTVADLLADDRLPRPELRICFTVDEEIGRGVDAIDLDRLAAEVAYTVDGGAVGTFSFETFNAAEARIRVRGVGVHPGYAKGVMANAATILAGILARLPAEETPEATSGREGYFCPYEVEGTVTAAEARVLLRDFTADGLERRKGLIEALAADALLEHPRAGIEVEIEDSYRNMREYIEASDPRAITFAFAAAERLGVELVEELVRGGTDGSRLSELGLPTPNVFTGGHDFHSRFEWNTVQNLEASLTFVKGLVGYWAEHGGDGVDGGEAR